MDIEKFRQGQEIMTDILAKDLEEYHKLVNQKLETFTWKIFAGFLLSKGWTHKDRYLIWNPPECYSCGQEITIDSRGRIECYCNECERMDKPYNPFILDGEELKKTEESRKEGKP